MAISVPTTPPIVLPGYFRRGRPILSGDAAGDLVYGWRGVSSLTNHAYAYRVQRLLSVSGRFTTDVIYSDNTTSWTVALEYTPVSIGADVVSIDVTADIEDGGMRVYLDGAQIATEAATSGRTIHTLSGTVTSGDHRIRIYFVSRSAGVLAKLYSLTIDETALVAGDFPA